MCWQPADLTMEPNTSCCRQTLYASIRGWSCIPKTSRLLAVPGDSSAVLSADGLNTDFIPSGLRRRCSTVSKVTLAVAYAAARGRADLKSLPSVFSSAHGESDITANLLHDLAILQPLSPMGFSLSVHNAASGLFSIATGNTAPSTAIAAGPHSCIMGLCEALLIVREDPQTPVLFVCSDDRVPSVFLPDATTSDNPFALAVLFAAPGSPQSSEVKITIDQQPTTHNKSQQSTGSTDAIDAFTAWLEDRTPYVELPAAGSVWRFEATTSRAALFTSPHRV